MPGLRLVRAGAEDCRAAIRDAPGVEESRACRARAIPARRQQARRDVGAVGVADGDELRWVEAVLFGGGLYEIRQLVGAEDEVLVVEDALGEAAEEAWGAVLGDLAAGAQDGRFGEDLLA